MQRRSGRPGAATELTVPGAWSLAIGRSPTRSRGGTGRDDESNRADRGARALGRSGLANCSLLAAPLRPYAEGGSAVRGSNGRTAADPRAGARCPYLERTKAKPVGNSLGIAILRQEGQASRRAGQKNRINANFLRVVSQIEHSLVRMPYARVGALPEFQQLHSQPDVQKWFDAAQRFAVALIEVVEFLRSRLPGYPSLLVPDLLPEASRVDAGGFWDMRFPWELQIRQAKLHFANQPPQLAGALELPDRARAAYAALGDVARALHETEAWRRFADIHTNLSPGDREAAKASRRGFREAVSEARIAAVAGGLAIRVANMRRAELQRIKALADGRLREYYDAFAAVDELIDAIAAFVSHRVAEGRLDELIPFEADWGPAGDIRPIRFRAMDDAFRRNYELIKVSGGGPKALAGVVVLHNLTINLPDEDGATTLTADGQLLVGSADIPAAPRT
jgi:hypothetical protein